METRTVGVEEELLVVDPATRSVTARARLVLCTRITSGTNTATQPTTYAKNNHPPAAT